MDPAPLMSTPICFPAGRIAERRAALHGCQFFTDLPAEDLAAVEALALTQLFAKDDYLFHEGEPARGFYLVRKGAINVHRVNARGREQMLHVFRSGESFAEAALTAPTGYPASARASEPSTVLFIPKVPLFAFIGSRPDLAVRLLGSVSAHLRLHVDRSHHPALTPGEKRLLHWLIKHDRRTTDGVVRLPRTKRVLTAALATNRETLSRILVRLRVRKKTNLPRPARVQPANLAAVSPDTPSLRLTDTVYLRAGRKAHFAPVADISVITAHDNYSEVQLADGAKIFLRRSLKVWEDTLPATHFMRVHRTQIVNLARVTRYERDADEHTLLYVIGATEPASASRDRWSELRERLRAIRPTP